MKRLVIGFDKVLHFSACLLITAIIFAGLYLTGAPNILCICSGFGVAMIIGFAKEFYDNNHGGKFDWKDILADFIGAAISSVILYDMPVLTAVVICIFAIFVLTCVQIRSE